MRWFGAATFLCTVSLVFSVRINRPTKQIVSTPVLFRRISDEACDEYAKQFPTRLYPYMDAEYSAIEGEFPHLVNIYYMDEATIRHLSGGVLISPRFVLTVAQLIIHQQTMHKIRMGTSSKPSDMTLGQIYAIEEFIAHPKYKIERLYYDIALIKTVETIDFSLKIRPACLFTDLDVPNLVFTSPGWGSSDIENITNALSKAEFSIVSIDECCKYFHIHQIPFGIICGVDKTGITGHCQGDSGSPMQFLNPDNGMFTIIALSSFGRPGCDNTIPSVFTNVSDYLNWIELTVWPESIY